jgi:hypothetical protein
LTNSTWNFLLTPTLQTGFGIMWAWTRNIPIVQIKLHFASICMWYKWFWMALTWIEKIIFLHCLIWKRNSLVVKTLMNLKIIHQLLLNQNSSNTYTRYKSLKCPICIACPFTRVYECYFTYTPSLTPSLSNRKFKCTYQSHVFFKSFLKSMSSLVMSILSLKN